jgi:O-methyltransferase/methyltransferase family protein
MHTASLTPDRIVEIGCGFRAAKTLLSAIELDLFTELAERPLDSAALMTQTGLHERGARDFFDALVALGVLERDDAGRYANTRETGLYLDRRKPTYLGGMFEQLNAREYGMWGSLSEALRTGMPQTGIEETRHFTGLYADPTRFRTFVSAMTAGSLTAATAIAAKFPWADYQTFIDIGTSQGCLPVQVALANPHLRGGGFDLPELRQAFESYVGDHGLSGRLQFHPGSFFEDALPPADVMVLGRVLHNWDLPTKRMLLEKVYAALPPGGALIVYETLVADDRRTSAAGLLASLNMLLWTTGGFDFSGADCAGWMQEAGFHDMRVEPLAGAQSMVVGFK